MGRENRYYSGSISLRMDISFPMIGMVTDRCGRFVASTLVLFAPVRASERGHVSREMAYCRR
ncbi:hypothetical protein KCP74_06180 [Salmonella enterica subsp. enterica]|nr:hypothetical protein KCP74_06180 [Salmonella enterica subsp. enterica]